jgi:hypothetical protein
MKKLFITLAILFATATFSCKKDNNGTMATLALVQHKWMLVSQNGEAFRYVGTADDYYDFKTDNILYKYANKNYDTLAYTLLKDNKTLALYPVMNGVKSTVPAKYTIKVLDTTRFVFSNIALIYSLDSLQR